MIFTSLLSGQKLQKKDIDIIPILWYIIYVNQINRGIIKMIEDSVVSWLLLTFFTFWGGISLLIKGINEKEKYKSQNERIFISNKRF